MLDNPSTRSMIVSEMRLFLRDDELIRFLIDDSFDLPLAFAAFSVSIVVRCSTTLDYSRCSILRVCDVAAVPVEGEKSAITCYEEFFNVGETIAILWDV